VLGRCRSTFAHSDRTVGLIHSILMMPQNIFCTHWRSWEAGCTILIILCQWLLWLKYCSRAKTCRRTTYHIFTTSTFSLEKYRIWNAIYTRDWNCIGFHTITFSRVTAMPLRMYQHVQNYYGEIAEMLSSMCCIMNEYCTIWSQQSRWLINSGTFHHLPSRIGCSIRCRTFSNMQLMVKSHCSSITTSSYRIYWESHLIWAAASVYLTFSLQ